MKDEKPYTIGRWKGFEQFKCRVCPFDTLREAEAIEHYESKHKPPPDPEEMIKQQQAEARKGSVFVADKAGRVVNEPAQPSAVVTLDDVVNEAVKQATEVEQAAKKSKRRRNIDG